MVKLLCVLIINEAVFFLVDNQYNTTIIKNSLKNSIVYNINLFIFAASNDLNTKHLNLKLYALWKKVMNKTRK